MKRSGMLYVSLAALIVGMAVVVSTTVAQESQTLETEVIESGAQTWVRLSPTQGEQAGAAVAAFSLEGIPGAEDTVGALDYLTAHGISVSLHCPEAGGAPGVSVPFDEAVVCASESGWGETLERIVVLDGMQNAGAPEVMNWQIHHQLMEPTPVIKPINPKDLYAIKEVGMTEHVKI